jgi:hypothetical protein
MVTPPDTAGELRLELQMVSELVTWFSDQGSPAVTAPVTVRAPDLAGLLAAPPTPARAAPSLTVVTDRATYQATDRQRLTVRLVNPGRPGNFDAYMILRGEDGDARFFDGERLALAGSGSWPAWVRRLPLPAEVTGRFTVLLQAPAPGRYTWDVVLTEPGRRRAVARAAATFTVDKGL